MGHKNTVRVVTRARDGTLRIRDYPSTEPLLQMHTQIGIDDCSTDLGLRGLPVFRGLIGPMPEGQERRPLRIARRLPRRCSRDTASDGCAPLPSQSLTFVSSRSIVDGSVCGL